MADAVSGLTDRQGRAVPLRIGMACGPVVAGVVGAKKFFYDVWGDAVNVASRMETTDVEGRIQVPDDVYQRLRERFVLEERGYVEVRAGPDAHLVSGGAPGPGRHTFRFSDLISQASFSRPSISWCRMSAVLASSASTVSCTSRSVATAA